MSTEPTCACCGLPFSEVDDIEPAFMLPDAIAGRDANRSSARHNGDFADLFDGALNTRHYFVRALFPFEVTDRDLGRPFRWGIWVEVSEPDFSWIYSVEVVRRGLADPAELGLPPPEPIRGGQHFEAKIANQFALPGVLGLKANLVAQENPKHRPLVVMATDDDCPLAVLQREGVTWEQTREWVKPFHGMMRQQRGTA